MKKRNFIGKIEIKKRVINMQIDIVSGFLGAGKTSLIRRVLQLNRDRRIAIIENEFGEVNIDSSVLNDYDIKIKEINAGCICCSVSGDLEKGIEELNANYNIDKIIIEPTGIAKLSQIKDFIKGKNIEIIKSITVIDANNFFIYLENFGNFYRDQIENADIIYINRLDRRDRGSKNILDKIKEINNKAKIVLKEIDYIENSDLELDSNEKNNRNKKISISRGMKIKKIISNKNIDKFESVSLELKRDYSEEEVNKIIEKFKSINSFDDDRKILRAKGILNSGNSKIHFEYLPNTERIERNDYSIREGKVVIIGINLNRKEIKSIFD
ncbi:MAG: GTP-binding protein [Andreesenia angusta]|nr:GTP-binding protein [Andreesenia angusta]